MTNDRLNIGPQLVRRLVNAQFPQWRELDIQPVQTNGWDNATFRLGDQLKVRLPTAERYAAQVKKENRWLPFLAPLLPVQIPTVLALGSPSNEYPFHWSICSWIEGNRASELFSLDQNAFAEELAQFLVSLQNAPTDGAPRPGLHNFFRGGSLQVYDSVRTCMERLNGKLDISAAKFVWHAALASKYDAPDVWIHGDFAANNLLVASGRLAAVIDFGCSGIGDLACDLVIAWTSFQSKARERFRLSMGVDRGTWTRAQGWALWKALLDVSEDSETGDSESCKNAARVITDILSENEQ